jgi:hypothetical protein
LTTKTASQGMRIPTSGSAGPKTSEPVSYQRKQS